MSNDISEVNMLRDYIREIYVESYHSPNGHVSIHSPSGRTENQAKSRLHAFFEENFITKNNKKEDVLKFDTRSVNQNPLFDIWKMCKFKPEYISRDFAVFDLLSSPKYINGITEYDLMKEPLIKNTFKDKDKGPDRLTQYLLPLRSDGIFLYEQKDRKDGKARERKHFIPDTSSLQMLIKSSPEIIAAIQFASETFPCGVIGSYILDSIDEQNHPSFFNFKHHFIYNTLDSEVIYTIFSAINEKRQILINHKKKIAPFQVIPIQIRYSARDGRSYLVYYTNYKKFKGFNVENIENIISVKKSDEYLNFDSLLYDFNKMKLHLWGKSLTSDKGKTEHVDFTIQYKDSEKYTLKRLQRESFLGQIECNNENNEATFSFELYDSKELIPWIRSYFGRINSFNFGNEVLQNQLTEEIKKLYANYNKLPYSSNKSQIKSVQYSTIKSSFVKNYQIIDDETNFFNRIYSAYYKIALKTIKAINKGDISTDEELNSYISSFKILQGKTPAKSKKYQSDFLDATADLFKTKNGKLYTPFTNIPDDFMFPLTTIEISFLKTLLNDNKCRLILGKSYDLLKSELDKPVYNEIYPYFNKDNYLIFDQYINGDQALYENENYSSNFNQVLNAVNKKQPLYFEYTEDDVSKTKISIPEKIEYSQKEDRFKVVLNSKNRPLDIQNVRKCEYSDKPLSNAKKKDILTCVVAIDIAEDKKFIRDRFFREFSPFERDCEKIDETGHILSFKFEKGDFKEISYRLLQFGPYVYCSEPECVRERIKEKVNMQYKLLKVKK